MENLGEGSAVGKTGEGVSGQEKRRNGKEGGSMLRRLPVESLLFFVFKGPARPLLKKDKSQANKSIFIYSITLASIFSDISHSNPCLSFL